jgi:hypothetical protein
MTHEDASKGGLVSFLLRGRELKLNIRPGLANGTRIKISKTAENTPENKKIERNTYFYISISEPAPPSRFTYLRSLLRGFGEGAAGQEEEQPKTFQSPNGSVKGGVAMQLKLKRSQRTGGMMGGKVVYMLDARAELTPEERSLVTKHGLGKIAIYDSEARKKRMQTAGERISAGGLLDNVKGIASVAMASMALQVTIDSLMSGHHIECKTMDELIGADSAIREGCEMLRTYLDLAATFDGREEIVEY